MMKRAKRLGKAKAVEPGLKPSRSQSPQLLLNPFLLGVLEAKRPRRPLRKKPIISSARERPPALVLPQLLAAQRGPSPKIGCVRSFCWCRQTTLVPRIRLKLDFHLSHTFRLNFSSQVWIAVPSSPKPSRNLSET
jgi:hypothetical protein